MTLRSEKQVRKIISYLFTATMGLWLSLSLQAQTLPDIDDEMTNKRVMSGPIKEKIYVQPKEAYLAVATTALVADVEMVLTAEATGRKFKARVVDQQGTHKFERLTPGRYRVTITHSDYQPFNFGLTLKERAVESRVVALVPKYGTIVLGAGDLAVDGASVKLDGVVVPRERLEIKNGILILTRVPVGKHQLGVVKEPYETWMKSLEVTPGSNQHFLDLKRTTIQFTIKSEPLAEVFIGDEKRALTNESGTAVIQDLLPGTFNLRVVKPGFHDAQHTVTLKQEERETALAAPLESVLDNLEFSDEFTTEFARRWWPQLPATWQLQTVRPMGRVIKGDAVALASNTTKANHRFNIYGDFTLKLNAAWQNGKGAAWVVRAQDESNYYLFELDRAGAMLHFYHCQQGTCGKQDSQPVIVDLSNTALNYTILLTATGNKFRHTISTPAGERPLGGVFTHDALPYGGVGLRAINGLEMLEQEFFVQPINSPR